MVTHAKSAGDHPQLAELVGVLAQLARISDTDIGLAVGEQEAAASSSPEACWPMRPHPVSQPPPRSVLPRGAIPSRACSAICRRVRGMTGAKGSRVSI